MEDFVADEQLPCIDCIILARCLTVYKSFDEFNLSRFILTQEPRCSSLKEFLCIEKRFTFRCVCALGDYFKGQVHELQ